MKNKKTLFISVILTIALVLTLALTSAEVSYCCEKTTSGAWCQNAPESECDLSDNLRSNPTSCEATSYCRLGTCIDSQEGTCMENTPQQVCEDSDGVWNGNDSDDIPRCQLGCCLIGDQAAFVTQTRCKRLSLIYSLEIDFRTDMQDELTCILSASSSSMGACVYEKDFTTTCTFVSQSECNEMSSENLEVKFHDGYLCSAEELGTDCAATEETVCVEGEDVVRFVDSCGNLANVYDSSKIKNKVYWSKIVDESESCGYGDSNSDNKECGNCDYLLGSTCREYERSEDKSSPEYGDNICRDLSCEYEGESYRHGETWCADSKGTGRNYPGSRYFRLMCYNGEVQIEPCADYRQEICIQDEVNDFKTAACRVNMWQDCYSQDNILDCLNSDKRDCKWQPGVILGAGGNATVASELGETTTSAFPEAAEAAEAPTTSSTESTTSGTTSSITGNFIAGIFDGDKEESVSDVIEKFEEYSACVPKYTPGFDFWQEGGATQYCPLASQECIVTYTKGLMEKERECVDNCWCLDPTIRATFIAGCNTIGDCGLKVNYLGTMGRGDTEITEEEVDEEDDE